MKDKMDPKEELIDILRFYKLGGNKNGFRYYSI